MSTVYSENLNQAFQQVRQAAGQLALVSAGQKREALTAMAAALMAQKDDILEANTLDLEASREMAVSDLILDWLKLTPERLQGAVDILSRLAALGYLTPLQAASVAQSGIIAAHRTVPLGVVALIYEAFPEIGAIAAALNLYTGNGLILRGGNEASQTNQMIVQALRTALAKTGLPESSLVLLSPGLGETLQEVVSASHAVDLVIPYGRPSLIQQVMRQATVPVLKTVMGNCYLYWGGSGSLETTLWMISESHRGEPDPINSIEKVLIPEEHSTSTLTRLWNRLWERGYELRGDPSLVQDFPDLLAAEPEDWSQPYLTKTIAFQRVADLKTAIAIMNRYSSGHADCLVTNTYQESQQFASGIRSQTVYINQSPRFSRNPDQASEIALGVAVPGMQPGGLIGLETLTQPQRLMQGNLKR
ncbi:MAG: glutamate-5-semialdehyde dehydrogenase [Cyanobacteria bacterium J06635_15]